MNEWGEAERHLLSAPVAPVPHEEAARPTDTGDVAEEAEGTTEDEDDERFWPALKAKLISWPSMQPSLRLITGIAVAQLLAAGANIALHGLPSAQIALGLQFGHMARMAVPYFWTGVIFMGISLSFLMTGAMMMRWPIRLLALVLFTASTAFIASAGAVPTVRIIVVVALWLWAGLLSLARHDDTPGNSAKNTAAHHLKLCAAYGGGGR